MSSNTGKINPGIEYQFRVITYAAACLSENKDVEEYKLYTNRDNIPNLDDLIVRVKYKSKPDYFGYLCQIKHLSSDYNFDRKKDTLMLYKEGVDTVISNKCNYDYLKDIPNENLEFWFFTNNRILSPSRFPIMLYKEVPYRPIECDMRRDENYTSIFPLVAPAACFKLTPKYTTDYSYFFEKFHLFLLQPDRLNILTSLSKINKEIFTEDTTTKIATFVYDYFTQNKDRRKKPLCLTKEMFETELLRLYLSTFTVSPKWAIEIDDQLASMWNCVILNFDITVVDNDIVDMLPYLFGCFWQKVKDLYDNTFDWNHCIDNAKVLNDSFNINNVIMHLRNNTQHWFGKPPDTLDSLLSKMWKCDCIPLILNTDCKISVLERYKHLRKKIIILDSKHKISNEVRTVNLNVFTSAADLRNGHEASALFEKILISLQGKPPINLLSLLEGEEELMRHLKCSNLLHLIEKRKLFFRKECLKETRAIIFFVINGETYKGGVHDLRIPRKNTNLIINCVSEEEAKNYATELSNKMEFNHYSIYLVQEKEHKLQYISGDTQQLTNFMIDQNGNEVYFDGNRPTILIGKTLYNDDQRYIKRYLKHASLEKSFISSQEGRIYIVNGDASNFQAHSDIKDVLDPTIGSQLREGKNICIEIDDKNFEESWRKLKSHGHSMFQIKVNNDKMELQRFIYKGLEDIHSLISYDGENFEETEFFSKTTDGIVVISGEPGIGKSTLLRSLFKNYNDCYSLFCNLVDYRNDLKSNEQMLIDPVHCILHKFEQLTFSKLQSAMYDNFINALCTHYKSKRKLVLFIDSFDEILPIYKKEVFEFLKILSEINIRIIIASRLIADELLINRFEVQPIKVSEFKKSDIRQYFQNTNFPIDKIPSGLVQNPLHLSLLENLYKEGALTFNNIDTFNLCKNVIEKKIELYYSRKGEHYNPETYHRVNVLKVHKLLAAAVIFGKETVVNNEDAYKELVTNCKDGPIKLGLIVRFPDNYPVFLHHTYGEFLVAEWLNENINQDFVTELYLTMLNDRYIHVRRFFDTFLCEKLELHRAVLQENIKLVDHLCVKKTECLSDVDTYNRTPLHLAASYCYNETTFTINNCKILEIIARYMEIKPDNLDLRDSVKGYKWFEYIQDNERISDIARPLGLTRILETMADRFRNLLSYCFLTVSLAVEHNYYWRDYRGSIPDDAFSGAENLYVAQVVSYWLMPGTFDAKTNEVYTEQGDRVIIKDNFKLLCDLHSDNFFWKKVNINELVGRELEDLVVGGMELNTTLYIGKTYSGAEWKIGKVFPPTHEFKGLRVWDETGGRYVTENFEILKYRLRHKYEHICDCKFKHVPEI